MSSLWPGLEGPSIQYISGPPGDEFLRKSPRGIALLGSTGSIGRNALAVIENSCGKLKAVALAAGYNATLLAQQANRHRPEFLAIATNACAQTLVKLLSPDYHPHILVGQPGYAQLATLPAADCVLSAQAGSAGLAATLAAAFANRTIALANKESLVMAGTLLRRICKNGSASILPVDSEHQAIFQCIAGRNQEPAQIILTASGGPFLNLDFLKTQACLPQHALKHPTWNMGAKISIDSATLMNKGLEFIEAMHLYGLAPENIEILIHPQSIVHSLARFRDESLLAQLAVPDMRLAIGICLLWPSVSKSFIARLDLASSPALQFRRPDLECFPCLALALNAARSTPEKGWQEIGLNPACIILNAANETAVQGFLAGKYPLGEIAARTRFAMLALRRTPPPQLPSLETLEPWQKALALANVIDHFANRARRLIED